MMGVGWVMGGTRLGNSGRLDRSSSLAWSIGGLAEVLLEITGGLFFLPHRIMLNWAVLALQMPLEMWIMAYRREGESVPGVCRLMTFSCLVSRSLTGCPTAPLASKAAVMKVLGRWKNLEYSERHILSRWLHNCRGEDRGVPW